MKKSFTLLEVIVSITIFMIVLLFLYKVLDQTKLSNKLFENRKVSLEKINRLNNIILEDIAEAIIIDKAVLDKEKNTRYQFTSNNTYHNAYYKYITYMISSNDKLVRIESLKKFKFENDNIEFYDNAYVDILLENIEFFEVNNNAFIIKQKDKKRIVFKAFKLK